MIPINATPAATNAPVPSREKRVPIASVAGLPTVPGVCGKVAGPSRLAWKGCPTVSTLRGSSSRPGSGNLSTDASWSRANVPHEASRLSEVSTHARTAPRPIDAGHLCNDVRDGTGATQLRSLELLVMVTRCGAALTRSRTWCGRSRTIGGIETALDGACLAVTPAHQPEDCCD